MRSLCFGLLVALMLPAAAADTNGPIDVMRGRELMRRFQAGEKLSPEDQAYLDRVRQEIRRRRQQQGTAQPAASGTVKPSVPETVRNLVPLTELTGSYKGEDGGLYGGGRNSPPEAHQLAYLKESARIRPLDAQGKPDDDGKIALITIGFSNTHLESADFKQAADADSRKSPRVVVVDGAIGMRAAVTWAYDGAEVLSPAEQERLDKEMDLLHMPKERRNNPRIVSGKDTWPTLDARLRNEGVTPQQVQALWMKHVDAGPAALGEFPAHARALEADLSDILLIAKHRFANLRVAYLSSRTYAGWNPGAAGSPEPYAYETAFSVRWLVQHQIKGDPQLNYDPDRGQVTAPLVLWGPYLWACGDTARKTDGLVWTLNDVRSDDRIHPSASGCRKVTEMLLTFLLTDPGARLWFAKP